MIFVRDNIQNTEYIMYVMHGNKRRDRKYIFIFRECARDKMEAEIKRNNVLYFCKII